MMIGRHAPPEETSPQYSFATSGSGATAPRLPWKPTVDAWRERCEADSELRALSGGSQVGFAVRAGEDTTVFTFHEGILIRDAAEKPAFSVTARPEAWEEFFAPVPRPTYQSFFGMLMRVPGTQVDGDALSFAQHAHVVRRVLELGRFSDVKVTGASQASRDVEVPADEDHIVGRYHHVNRGTASSRIFVEESGTGQDVLLLHTAGADGRQFHHLMNTARLRERCHFVSFDMPGHGRSEPSPGVFPGASTLTTDDYVDCVIKVVEAMGLNQPIILGCSMSGALCLELAYRYPDRLGGVVACEASERVVGRQVPWARHPLVNQTLFVPEWVDGLMAPQSPLKYRREIWWGYSQGGFGTFYGDILFYSGEWDGRDRVPHIDTNRCPVVMLTGEYDYSCTPEMSRHTAERIPGAIFRIMPNMGHFPPAENPPLFAGYLLEALDVIAEKSRSPA